MQVVFSGEDFAAAAAGIAQDELRSRGWLTDAVAPSFTLTLLGDPERPGEGFSVEKTGTGLCLRGGRLRALLYALGLFLRKAEKKNGELGLAAPIVGTYAPEKAVRGHQLGYRPLSNTYDKWTAEDYRRYLLDLAFFGMNTVELIPLGEKNALTVTDPLTMAEEVSRLAHSLDLAVSLWIPNGDGDEETELKEREEVFSRLPYIDALFIPGADPGELGAEEMVERTVKLGRLLHRRHPNAEVWPSAQAPHGDKDWGETFVREVNRRKREFTGVIQGPNRAFDIDVLREKLDASLPIRYYPDICHIVRCEYPLKDVSPVFLTGLGREPVCPRPRDYKALHEKVAPYTVGSVTYSDGVNDDVNKAVWCALEWDAGQTVEEIVEDYVRLYLPGRDVQRLAAGIFNAEMSFHRPPWDQRHDFTLYALTPEDSGGNWRGESLYFLAQCFAYLKARFLEDSALAAFPGDDAPGSPVLTEQRQRLFAAAKRLFDTVGMQLNVKDFLAYGVERGAVLDTIDLPVTDRERRRYLCSLAKSRGEDPAALLAAEESEAAHEDCVYYFSAALDPLNKLGADQPGDYYMNFLGDRPQINDGTLPVRLFCAFDHYTLDLDVPVPANDYTLVFTVYRLPEDYIKKAAVTVGGSPAGPLRAYPSPVPALPKDFSRICLEIPKESVAGGRLRVHLEEQTKGLQVAEIRVKKKRKEER